MAFTKALCSALLLYILACAHAEATIRDFAGVWRSRFDVPHLTVLTPQGPALLCRDALPPQCDAEIKPLEETYTFNGTTIALEVRDQIGIKTVEQATAVHPECAKEGLYPVERIYTIPPSQITSYDPEAERLYYIDPRRPEDLNCVPARYRIGAEGVYIEINHVIFYQGTIPDIFARGLSFRCEPAPKPCAVAVSDDGEIAFSLQFTFNLTCIDGDCLNIGAALAPAASHAPYESTNDV